MTKIESQPISLHRQAELTATLLGGVALPILIVDAYALYRLVMFGRAAQDFVPSCLLIVGGILSVMVTAWHLTALQSYDPSGRRSLLRRAPYFFSSLPGFFGLCVIFWLAIRPLYSIAMTQFSWLTLSFGLFWLIVGLRIFYANMNIARIPSAQGLADRYVAQMADQAGQSPPR